MPNSETENAFYFFFNLYFQEISLVIHSSLNDILPTDFLFYYFNILSSVVDLIDFQEIFHFFSIVMLVDLNQYHGTVRVDKKLMVQFVLILFCMILIKTVSFKNILNLIALDCMLSCHVRVSEWIHRSEIWDLSDCNWTRTHNHLVRKRPINHLAKISGCGLEPSCSHLIVLGTVKTNLDNVHAL